jgi:hypothetical protein
MQLTKSAMSITILTLPWFFFHGSQLGVGTDVQDTDLKKAYRKQAMKVLFQTIALHVPNTSLIN